MLRYIGMDVHREFAQLAVLEDGVLRDEGRIGVTPEDLHRWAEELRPDDQVALHDPVGRDQVHPLFLGLVDQPLSDLLLLILIELHRLDRVRHDPCFPAKRALGVSGQEPVTPLI